MQIWCKNSACRVLKNARPGRNDLAALALHLPKNGHAFGQIFLRDVEDFTLQEVTVTGLPDGIQAQCLLQGQVQFNDGVPYPDRLLPFASRSVAAHTAQGLWLAVEAAPAAPCGGGGFTVTLRTDKESFSVPVQVQVYDVLLPSPADGAFDHTYFWTADAMPRYGAAYALYTDSWWRLLQSYALAMKALRVNTLHINTFPFLQGEGSRRTGPDSWALDFSRLDKVLCQLLQWGSFRRIAIGAPLASLTGATITGFDENGARQTYGTDTPEGQAYARCLLTGLRDYFVRTGRLSMLVMHIADEPHETGHWLAFRELVRQLLPGVPCIEPLDMYQSALQLQDACDEFVPRLEVFEQGRDYFAQRAEAGKRVWCYSCCYPEESWYLNKFIDQPARYARLIKWACFSQGITGFLHWGFNYWDAAPYGMQPDARFKGDGYIVYPDTAHGTVGFSARGLATLEGIEEYELLTLAAKDHPQAALALAHGIARSFCDFCDEPDALELARIRLLSLCAAQG